jgi:hypothetical protein
MWLDEHNDLELCLDHYRELQEKIAKEKRHTVENCFCGKNHLIGVKGNE